MQNICGTDFSSPQDFERHTREGHPNIPAKPRRGKVKTKDGSSVAISTTKHRDTKLTAHANKFPNKSSSYQPK
jgi:hypothetical protein